MKIRIEREIAYSDVDSGFNMRVAPLFRLLQDAAITHSTHVGYGPSSLYKSGYSWILSKIALSLQQQPMYEDTATVITWSKKIQGFKAYRDFEIRCNDQVCATATSLWVFVDINQKRIRPIPAEMEEIYTVEKENACHVNLDQWKPSRKSEVDTFSDILLRYSDFDTNKHVNNSVYFDYIEDHFYRQYAQLDRIKDIRFQFVSEISSDHQQVQVGSSLVSTNLIRFKLIDNNTVFGVGEILV